jgi:AbiV family abortive infection protein
MARSDRVIPVSKLPEGIRLCAQNIRDFIVDANMLLSKGHGLHAIALAIFAFEELGKYAELQRLKESNKNKDTVSVPDALFYRHDYKQEVARKLVSEEDTILLPAYFDSKYFSPKYFQTEEVTPTPILRTQCVFVDWVDEDWRFGTPHDTERLKTFMNAILAALYKLETNM